MKAREARVLLRSEVHPKVLKVIESICDELSLQKQTQLALATMLNRTLDQLAVVQRALGNYLDLQNTKQLKADVQEVRQTHINSPENLDEKLSKRNDEG